MRIWPTVAREIDEKHTAENMTEELRIVLREWGLENMAYRCTTENAANIMNAVVDHLELVHLPCVGHTLQLSTDWDLQIPSIA